MECKKCGKINPDDAFFCSNCGERIERKTDSENHQTTFESNYCPTCGAKRVQDEGSTSTKEQLNINWKATLKFVSSLLAMLGIATMFVMTFFVGMKIALPQSLSSAIGELNLNTDVNIFYFFGKAYKEIEEALTAIGPHSSYYGTSAYLATVFGTIVSALFIIGMVICTTFATIKFINSVVFKKQNNFGQ